MAVVAPAVMLGWSGRGWLVAVDVVRVVLQRWSVCVGVCVCVVGV